jgi:hypothetical protein
MKLRYKIAVGAILIVPVALLIVAAGRQTPAVQAQLPQLHLDLVGAVSDVVPPDCSVWQELFPSYPLPHHQDGYEDNGDGVISPCDYIILDGVRYHVTWTGPTYFTTCLHNNQHYLEPTAPQTGEDPTCEIWQQVYPTFTQYHIDDWYDGNTNGLLDVCDIAVVLEINEYLHIDSIGVDIIVEPVPTATEESTWGTVKKLFGGGE